jgi:hypothetical protein
MNMLIKIYKSVMANWLNSLNHLKHQPPPYCLLMRISYARLWHWQVVKHVGAVFVDADSNVYITVPQLHLHTVYKLIYIMFLLATKLWNIKWDMYWIFHTRVNLLLLIQLTDVRTFVKTNVATITFLVEYLVSRYIIFIAHSHPRYTNCQNVEALIWPGHL